METSNSKVSVWLVIIFGGVVACISWYGVSHPAQSQSSFDNQLTAIANQQKAIDHLSEIVDLLADQNQKLNTLLEQKKK